jgi:hypothetical protein
VGGSQRRGLSAGSAYSEELGLFEDEWSIHVVRLSTSSGWWGYIDFVDFGYLKQLSSVTTGAHPLQMVNVWCFQVDMETFINKQMSASWYGASKLIG